MAVEGPVEVGPLDQVGELPLLRGLDLAGILAQLGRDLGQPERLEQLGLGLAGDRSAVACQGIFVEREPAGQGPLAHRDVVRLRPGEIVQGERELGVLDPPQVALHAVGQPDARLGRPVGQDRRHLRSVSRTLRGPRPDASS